MVVDKTYSSLLQLSAINPFIDADKQPADRLAKVPAFDVDKLLSKVSTISEGVIFNVQHSLLKELGLESLGVLPEDTMWQLLKEGKHF